MSTIDDPVQVAEMLVRDNPPPFFSIWRYTTGFGGEAFKIIYRSQDEEYRFLATGNIKSGGVCECLWEGMRPTQGKPRITEAGMRWLEQHTAP